MSGFVAWLLWLAVHLVALTASRTASPSVRLDYCLAGRGRPQRAITTQQVFARQVGEARAAAVNRGAAAFRSSSRG
jgi:NADH:ubiquinone reductase (H+-translocating)